MGQHIVESMPRSLRRSAIDIPIKGTMNDLKAGVLEVVLITKEYQSHDMIIEIILDSLFRF